MNELIATQPGESSIIDLPVKRKPYNRPQTEGEPWTEETARANFRHDRKYGWSKHNSRNYTNMSRFPEFVKVRPGLKDYDEIWAELQKPREDKL